MTSFALMVLAVTIAGLVQGVIGVGFALIVAPLAAVLSPEMIPGSILILMLPMNAFVVWRERHHFDFSGAGWITLGRFAGTFVGLRILLIVSTPVLDVIVGGSTVLAALATKFAPAFAPNRTAFVGAGLITGVTETATGIGGPPLALVYQHHPAPILRATIALCFLVGQLFSLAVLVVEGRLNSAQVGDALLLMPPLVLGLLASGWAHRRLDAARLRDALLAFAVISGLLLIVQAMTRA
jgi:uncharacterized protein